MAEIRHYLLIRARPGVVYRALTEQSGLAAWWTRETVAEPRVGSIAEFKFGDRYHNKMTLTALEPDRRVEWECFEGDKEWVGTRFVFELEEKEGRTILRFGQLDWRQETDFFALCNTTWAHYMQSLKQYCETGEGTPFAGA